MNIQVPQLLTEKGTVGGDIFLRPAHGLGREEQGPPLSPHVSIQTKYNEGVVTLTLNVFENTESGIVPNLFEFRVLWPRADWTLQIWLAFVGAQLANKLNTSW